MTALELLRRRASAYELLAEWHAARAAGDPRYGDAADALVAVAIVLRDRAWRNANPSGLTGRGRAATTATARAGAVSSERDSGRATSELRLTAEVVCDQWGAIDRLNELIRWGWIKANSGCPRGLPRSRRRRSQAGDLVQPVGCSARTRILIDPLARERSTVPVGRHLRAMMQQLAA